MVIPTSRRVVEAEGLEEVWREAMKLSESIRGEGVGPPRSEFSFKFISSEQLLNTKIVRSRNSIILISLKMRGMFALFDSTIALWHVIFWAHLDDTS